MEPAEPFVGIPITPSQPRIGSGELLVKTQWSSNSVELAKDINTPKVDAYEYGTGKFIKYNGYNQSNGTSTVSFWKLYKIRTRPYRLSRVESKVDDVTTITDYTYDGLNRFLMPTETKTTNSEGKEYLTKMYYSRNLPSTHPNTAITSTFENLYMIGVPLRQESYFNGVLQGGSVLEYQIFGTGTGYTDFYPYKSYSINRDGSLKLNVTVDSYDRGLPTQMKKLTFVTPQTYTWDATKRLSGKNYGTLKWMFGYDGTSSLVNKSTDENGLIKKFTYDGLQRLQQVNDRMKPDGTDIQATSVSAYQYKNATNTYNFIQSTSTFKSVAAAQIGKQFMDGLGRPIMTERYNNDNTYTKNYVTYDALGRPDQTFEPIVSNTEGVDANYLTTVLAGKAYTQPTYEASALSRPTAQRNLDGTFVYMAYGTNTATEVIKFSIISNASIDADDVVAANGNYDANSLSKTTITNENGKLTQVFKDKMGRVVLTRKFLNGTNVDTYNVYDDYGNLVMVIPPDAINASNVIKLSLVFCYKYDNQNRLCRKQVPGADWQKFYYDSRDLLTLTQDGNMRSTASGGNANKYLGTQYDDLGRVLRTGFVTTASPLTYASSGFTITDVDRLTETQYYKRDAVTGLISTTGTLGSSWVKHQGSRVLKPTGVTTNTDFVWSYIERRAGLEYTGNPVWTGKQHLLHAGVALRPIDDNDQYGVDWSVSAYDGAQKPTVNYRYLLASPSMSSGTQVRTHEVYTYDNLQRLTNVQHTYALNGAGITTPTLTLSNMVYNFKDQLTEKNIGKQASNGKYLQSIDYDYNTRGWLTGINSAFANSSLDLPLINNTDNYNSYTSLVNGLQTPPANSGEQNPDLFKEKIRYTDPVYTYPGVGPIQYNGNISQLETQVAGREAQAYSFKYDDLDRLTDATYTDVHSGSWTSNGWTSQTSSDNKYRETATYDKRGNIQTMIRNGLQGSYVTSPNIIISYFTQTDNLSYSYDPNNPNRLTKVSEAGNLARGFVSANNGAATHYTYDMNGNMITDANKNITSIEYNYLNLPQVITFSGNRIIQFIYDATGAKLRKITNNNGTITTYDYVGGVEYRNNVLERFANTEGSVINNGSGSFEYEYVLRDHLGNTRVTFNGNADGTVTVNNIKQINHYYPFGMNTEGNWNGASGKNKYQYNGKELNEDFGLNWNDYGARFYDAAIGRWNVIDPLAEKFISYNPYNYVMNRPTIMIDPNGMEAVFNANTGEIESATGKDAQNYVRGLQRNMGKGGSKESGNIKYSSTVKGNGDVTVNLDISIKIYNKAGANIDVDRIASAAERTFKGTTSWTFDNGTKKAKQRQITLVTNFNIVLVNSIAGIGKNDFAIGIVNNVVHKDRKGGQGVAEIGGYYGAVGKFEGIGTYVHEIGHILGLDDRYDTKTSKANESGGIMNDSKTFAIPQSDVFSLVAPFLNSDTLGKSGFYDNYGRRQAPDLQSFLKDNTN
jgi:RHS repeat-associated protein